MNLFTFYISMLTLQTFICIKFRFWTRFFLVLCRKIPIDLKLYTNTLLLYNNFNFLPFFAGLNATLKLSNNLVWNSASIKTTKTNNIKSFILNKKYFQVAFMNAKIGMKLNEYGFTFIAVDTKMSWYQKSQLLIM